MHARIARLASAAAIAAALAIPGSAVAGEPTAPPAAVTEWRAHLAHMQSMAGPLGTHVVDCIEMHGSMAGLFGPNGSMTGMMSGRMMR